MLWGQADWLIDEIILTALSITRKQQQTLIGEKPLGPKLDLLKKHLDDIADARAREAAKAIHQRLNDTKAQRNHAFHGIWGWRANPRSKKVERCSRHPKALDNPIKAQDLPKLEQTLCEAVTQGIMAVWLIRGREPESAVARFLHGRDEDVPEWFRQWSEQHPLLGDNWDRNWSAGQLPRLVDPMR
ncbi:hypothetical protein [Altererythrobacter sp. C41]|uniref:hypothetical protein n=1 Tax=Altererythrobacter sp. C41 TaxID=2806021 RepID=UPI001931B655|nr:hypothetical protein [Altererythrobacter sp. C41]MBM0170090.1 hypothetical protein [Altererythrobacter sp. C41]